MHFKLTEEHLYWWPVKVDVPDPKLPGKFQTQEFQMQFLAMPLDEARALRDEIMALPEAEREKHEHDQMVRVCRDWNEDVVGEDGKPIPFSDAALNMAMQSNWFRVGLYRAYHSSLISDGARLGN